MNKKSPSQLSAEDKEQQYRIIFEAASDGMIISDAGTGRVVDANPAAIAMHGYTREEFIGLHSMDIRASRQPAAVQRSRQLTLNGKACSTCRQFICIKTAHRSMWMCAEQPSHTRIEHAC